MATRNLYNVDSVACTLLWGILKQDRILVGSTLGELIASDESDLANRLLLLGWVLSPPEPSYSRRCYDAWIADPNPLALGAAVISGSSYELPPLPEAPPLLPRKQSGASVVVRPSWVFPVSWTTTQQHSFAAALDFAVKRKHHTQAAWLSSLLPTPTVCCILQSYGVVKPMTDLLESIVYAPLADRLVQHLFAALTVDKQPVARPLPRTKSDSSRSFSVSVLACDLWNVTPAAPQELLGLPIHVVHESASNYWKDLVEKCAITVVGDSFKAPTDDQLESFYSLGFPQDIPDEWSNVERVKSHPQWTVTSIKNVWRTAFLLCFT